MPFSFKATVVCGRIDLDGKPDLEAHAKATRGARNRPVLLPDGRQAVNPDGTPQVVKEEYVHVLLQQAENHRFHIEVPADQVGDYPIGKEVTITVE